MIFYFTNIHLFIRYVYPINARTYFLYISFIRYFTSVMKELLTCFTIEENYLLDFYSWQNDYTTISRLEEGNAQGHRI